MKNATVPQKGQIQSMPRLKKNSPEKLSKLVNEASLKEVFNSRMLSLTSKRMIDIEKIINAEMGKINRIDGNKLPDYNKDEDEETGLNKIFRKDKSTKQQILDICKRLHEKNLRQNKKALMAQPFEEPKQDIIFAPPSKQPKSFRKNFIFSSLSRERRSQVLEKKEDYPPIGFYRPRYKIIDKKDQNFSFIRPRNSTRISRSNSIISENKPKKSTDPLRYFLPKPILELKNSLFLSPSKNSKPSQKHKESKEPEDLLPSPYQGRRGNKIHFESMKRPQKSLHQLFRNKLLKTKPNFSTKKQQTYLTSLPSCKVFEANQKPQHEMGQRAFSTLNLFPDSVSRNSRITTNISIDKYSSRKDIFTPTCHDTPGYSPNYDFLLRKTTTALPFGNKSKVKFKKRLNVSESIKHQREDNDPEEIKYQDEQMILQAVQSLNLK